MLSWPLAESNVNNLRHFTLYNASINKKRAGVHSLTLYTHSIESKAISFSPISKITVNLVSKYDDC